MRPIHLGVIALAAALVLGFAAASNAEYMPLYLTPVGGWDVWYGGDQDDYGDTTDTIGANALDGNWTHNHSSDEWGGNPTLTPPEPPFRPDDPSDGNNNGGVKSYTDVDGTSYLRVADVLAQSSGSYNNRKLGFYYEDLPGVLDDPAYPILDSGCTLTLRTRLPAELVDGLQGPDGKIIDNDGRGLFSLQQNIAEAGGAKQIGFSLAVKDVDVGSNSVTVPENGLIMNNLNGTSPTSNVDTGEVGTMNFLAMDVTQFHELWITIEADTSGGGTHKVSIYLDGSLTASIFDVTAGTKAETNASLVNNAAGLGFLHNQSSLTGMFDLDYIGFAAGVHTPEVPEPTTWIMLLTGGLLALLAWRRR